MQSDAVSFRFKCKIIVLRTFCIIISVNNTVSIRFYYNLLVCCVVLLILYMVVYGVEGSAYTHLDGRCINLLTTF